eukprot:scaffold57955_cov69-Phaeocystis_antarctica.AAC.2
MRHETHLVSVAGLLVEASVQQRLAAEQLILVVRATHLHERPQVASAGGQVTHLRPCGQQCGGRHDEWSEVERTRLRHGHRNERTGSLHDAWLSWHFAVREVEDDTEVAERLERRHDAHVPVQLLQDPELAPGRSKTVEWAASSSTRASGWATRDPSSPSPPGAARHTPQRRVSRARALPFDHAVALHECLAVERPVALLAAEVARQDHILGVG